MTKYLFPLLVSMLLFCCNKETLEEDNQPEIFTDGPLDSSLNGTWKLIDVSCYCAPFELEGDFLWTFDSANNNLTVSNAESTFFQLVESGTYNIGFEEEKIILEGNDYFPYFEDGHLFVPHSIMVADVPLMKFEKQ